MKFYNGNLICLLPLTETHTEEASGNAKGAHLDYRNSKNMSFFEELKYGNSPASLFPVNIRPIEAINPWTMLCKRYFKPLT